MHNKLSFTIFQTQKELNMKKYLFFFAIAVMAAVSCNEAEPIMDKADVVREVIMSRRAIRKYKAQTVSRDTLKAILEAGINAPNAMNKQSWEIRVVDKPEILESVKEAMALANPEVEFARECFRGAPVMIFIANDSNSAFSPIDCGLLSQNIMLSAWSMGVGSVCLGSPVRFIKNADNPSEPSIQEVNRMLDFSEAYELVICIGLGYPDETPEPKPRDSSKYRFID